MSSALSRSPLVFGGIGGVGEIGFFSTPLDNFGDDEKLLGFERGLKQAYEQGMDEFMIWGGEFTFDNPTIYFTKLKEFRDALILNPRQSEYDVRVMIDNKETLVKEIGQRALTELNMSEQPYLYLVRYLDHNGYSWFQTEPSARIMPNIIYKRTINLSQVKGLNEVQMNQTVSGILSGITPSGAYYPWVNNSNYSRSMTGMVNPYNISFIGGCITCDVFALSSEKLRIYAPRNTSVQIEYPQDVIILLLNDETVPFSKNIISSGKTLVRFNTSNAIKTSDIQFISGGPILTSINPNQIYNNTENTLVLTGSGFSRNCRIMLFDLLVGAPFITTYINSTHINFTVPAGVPLGVYSLSVMGNYSGQILRSQPINVTVTNPPLLFCGDGICNNGETCSSCSIDCGRCRGNGGGEVAEILELLLKLI